MQIDISKDIRKMDALGILPRLTDDKTTGRGILWGTDAYAYQGSSYEKDHEIKADLITGQNAELIQTRASKAMAAQSERTRQRAEVFTPIWVCRQMNDQADDVWFGRKNQMEANNPGCFDDPNKTFADLYMKSGMYITEIVKRLFRSEGLKKAFPNEKERIQHIIRHQVYGMAPTRIIYLIATNYILGFDPDLKEEDHNFVQADASAAAQESTLEELVNKCFSGEAPCVSEEL